MRNRRRRNFASNAAGKWNVRWPSASALAFTVCTNRCWMTLRDGRSTAWQNIGSGVGATCRNISATGALPDMTERREFHPLQAEEIARAFNEKGVDYLFREIAGGNNAGPA